MNRPIDLILSRLNGVVTSPDGKNWQANCPAHGDNSPSLSVSAGDDGRVLLHCHAGCDTEAVVKSISLQMSDLFPHEDERASAAPPKQAVTVQQLADAKALPSVFLNSLGVKDLARKPPMVGINYYLADGKPAERHRLRIALRAKDGSRWNAAPGTIVPYGLWRLPEARHHGFLILVEGESDCWTLWHHDIPALGIPGAKMAKTLDATHLEGIKTLFIVREPDQGGEAFADGMARRLKEIDWKGNAKMIIMPEDTKDPNELHKAVQHDEFKPKLQALLNSAQPLPEPEAKNGKSSGKKSGDSDKESDLDILIRLGNDGVELFHNPDGDGYAGVPVNGHRENWPIRAEGFEQWLCQAFYRETSRATNKETLQAGLNQLGAMARFDGPEREVFVRIAEGEDAIFVDLCDSSWRAVKITADGWQVVDSPEVRFRRSKGMLPLPEPVPGGSVNELRGFINAQDDDTWHLILGWLIQAYRPKGPYPLLVIQGEQGTAKSTLARLVRSLVDPGKPPYRTPPRSERDLSIAATNSWVISMDNLSGLPDWLSDALCRLSTGGGFGTRQLFANSDEIIFDAKRPAILNGIDDIAERQDLNDRSLGLRLRPIQDSQRKTEAQLMVEFELARPRIFGALLSALSVALGNQHSVKLKTMSRMADFLEWVTAAEPGLGVEAGAIAESYRRFRKEAVVDSLEFDEVATALQGYMENRADWTGTCTELLKELREFVGAEVSKTQGWPQLPNKLSERITRVASFLRAAGIDVSHTRVGKASTRTVVIRKMVIGTAGIVGIGNPVGDADAKSEPFTTDDQADATQVIQSETGGDEKVA